MPQPRPTPWYARPILWVELFALSNLAFLAVDIAIAHAVNAFANPAEWAPVVFSPLASLALLAAMALGGPFPTLPSDEPPGAPGKRIRFARRLGLAVGWASILVGVAGLVFHLESQFFDQRTLRSLVYTAPFAAPLAYTGLGLLVILNRMVPSGTSYWARWVLLLAMGGFLGNFVLTLADHAQNGFFAPTEWIGVVAAAFAASSLLALAVSPGDRWLRRLVAGVLVLQVGVGLLGFALHVASDLNRPGVTLAARFVFGAPAFAPLLFADLAVLGGLGLWALHASAPAASIVRPAASPAA
jgi:hypothetical protein